MITALIALNPPGGIVSLTAFSGSLYAACFFPAIAFGLHWSRGNGNAVLASFVVGLTILVTLTLWPLGFPIHPMFPAVALSTITYFVISLYVRPHEAPEVQRLFAPEAATVD